MKVGDYMFGKNFLIERIEGKTTVFDVKNSTFFSFNETGSLILDSIRRNMKSDEIVMCLIKKYSVSRLRAMTDIEDFLKLLLKNKIIYSRKHKRNTK